MHLESLGRRVAKSVSEAVLPASLVVWRGPADRRRVALTFDDGPTDLTRDYLAVLDRAGVRATFFVVGEMCARNPAIVAEMAARGHELASHGYTHSKFPRLCKLGLLNEELERTASLLPRSFRRRPWVRPPHGAVSLPSLIACARAGYTTVLWSHNSGDWCTQSASKVVSTLVTPVLPPGAIVLLHEGQTWTLEALPIILERLKEAGHELVTVGDLLGS